MGQYYVVVVPDDKNKILYSVDPGNYGYGMKLTEHSYYGSDVVHAVLFQLQKGWLLHKCRLVWAGDYADPETTPETTNKDQDDDDDDDDGEEKDINLYSMAVNGKKMIHFSVYDATDVKYILNHSKKEYVRLENELDQDKDEDVSQLHPLPLLVAEGNGRGGGDYFGRNKEMVGRWSRDIISAGKKFPQGNEWTEIFCDFVE